MTETLEQLIQQLRSPDAAQRRQAIMALADLRDPAALQPLAHIYNNDPDTELRDLALKAGRYIRQAADATPASAGIGTGTAAPSERDIDLAKSFLDAAANFMLAGDKGRAIENLGKALVLNPGLADETFIENMIMTVTGMAPAQVVPMLMHPDQREQLIMQVGGKRALTRVQEHHGKIIDNVTWNRVVIDLAAYWAVSAISSIVLLIFVLDLFDTMLNEGGYATYMPKLDSLFTASLPVLVLSSFVQSIGSVFLMVIFLTVTHYMAVLLFGGEAGMEVMFRKIVPLMTIFTAAGTIALVIFLLIGSVTSVWFLVPGVLGGSGLLFLVYIADILGKVYNFDFVSGCISVIIGAVIYMSVQGCISYLLGMAA